MLTLRDSLDGRKIVPVCPEVRGGLGTPRPMAEISGHSVIRQDGSDVTAEFNAGAESCLRDGLAANANLAILKSRSPSCGSGQIYDGSFNGTLTPGDGIFTRLLKSRGIEVISDEDWLRAGSKTDS